MITRLRQAVRRAVRRAMESSLVIRGARRFTANSILFQAVVAAARWLRRTRDGIVTGMQIEPPGVEQRRTTERLKTVASTSRVVAIVSSILNAPLVASREAAVTNPLHPLFGLDLERRVQMAALVAVIAVLTHTILFAALGVPVDTLGWGVRSGVIFAGLVVAWRPAAVAAAWRDRVPPTRKNHGVA
jgi:hypothetical protein